MIKFKLTNEEYDKIFHIGKYKGARWGEYFLRNPSYFLWAYFNAPEIGVTKHAAEMAYNLVQERKNTKKVYLLETIDSDGNTSNLGIYSAFEKAQNAACIHMVERAEGEAFSVNQYDNEEPSTMCNWLRSINQIFERGSMNMEYLIREMVVM